jgi:hypothetical protein
VADPRRATPSLSIEDIRHCNRLRGLSIANCGCRLGDGWAECPRSALGVLSSELVAGCRDAGAVARAEGGAVGLARASGYTGNCCDTCGGFRMRRTGVCETCDDCGATGGCG